MKRSAALAVAVPFALLLAAVTRAAHAQDDEALPPDAQSPTEAPLPVRRPPSTLSWSEGGAYESFDPPAWRRAQHGPPLPRVWLAPTAARLPSEGLALAGATVAFGFESQYSVSPTLNKWFYGSAFGLEARGQALRTVDGAPSSWLIAGGLALTMNVTEHGRYGTSPVRFPSLFGLFLPEAGVAARSPQPTSFYLRWSAPIAVLVERHLAVELVPAVSLLYQGAHGGVEAMWLLGVGVSWRAMGRPMLLL